MKKFLKKHFRLIILLVIVLILVVIFTKQIMNFVTPSISYKEFDNYIVENNSVYVYISTNKNIKVVKEYSKNYNYDVIYMFVNTKEKNELEEKYNIEIPNLFYYEDGNFSSISLED